MVLTPQCSAQNSVGVQQAGWTYPLDESATSHGIRNTALVFQTLSLFTSSIDKTRKVCVLYQMQSLKQYETELPTRIGGYWTFDSTAIAVLYTMIDCKSMRANQFNCSCPAQMTQRPRLWRIAKRRVCRMGPAQQVLCRSPSDQLYWLYHLP